MHVYNDPADPGGSPRARALPTFRVPLRTGARPAGGRPGARTVDFHRSSAAMPLVKPTTMLATSMALILGPLAWSTARGLADPVPAAGNDAATAVPLAPSISVDQESAASAF